MKIHLGTDHAGYELKEFLKTELISLGHMVTDHGADSLVPGDDYPDYVTPCAEAIAAETGSFGIILGHSGQGEAMCANKVLGIRAGVYYGGNTELVQLMREHNNANILSLGAHFVSQGEALAAVLLFLGTEFSNDERHVKRIAQY